MLEDCVCGDTESVPGAPTTVLVAARLLERHFQLVDFLLAIAARASRGIGPALSDDVFLACVIG